MADVVVVPVATNNVTVVKVPTVPSVTRTVPDAQVILNGESDSPDFDPVSVYNTARGGPI